MGETGCGKTSLIEIISQFINYNLITLNIHSGITDEDIVQFMFRYNLLEKEINHIQSEEIMSLDTKEKKNNCIF